jgi:hypothetical protein
MQKIKFVECCLLIVAMVLAQSTMAKSPENFATKLAGTTHRTWVFERFERIMGAGMRCVQGDTLEFFADQTVLVSRCIQGKISSEKQNWSLQDEGIDHWITIGSEQYLLLFTSDNKTMTLRKRSDVKSMATVDKEYHRLRN